MQIYEGLREEIDFTSEQEDVLNLVGNLLNRTGPASIGVITDTIYFRHFTQNISDSLGNSLIYTMYISDSESFGVEASENVQSVLMKMKERSCEFFIILITNGIQMNGFLKYVDYHRLLNTRAKIVMLYDYRLFTPDMNYIWKRIVNVIFIRRCDIKNEVWYELSTVPFPARVQEVFVPRVINFWTPNRYRWRREAFGDKIDQHLNGEKLSVVVLQHTPTVFKKVYINDNDEEHVEYSGLEIDLIDALSHVMNFTVEFYESTDSEQEKWGRMIADRNFTGLLGEMDEAQADIALGDLHYTMFNLKILDLSLPYNTECMTFLTPQLLTDTTWKTLIAPFSLGMWIGVLLSLSFSGIMFFAFSRFYVVIKSGREPNHLKQRNPYFARDFFDDISACILYTYSMILLVSLPRLPLRWSIRVLTGWWWIYCVLLVVAYRASLTSILANPQPRVTIDTVEFLSNSWVKCGAWGEQNRNFFTMSIDPAAQKVGSKLEHVDDTAEAVSNLHKSRVLRTLLSVLFKIKRVADGDFAYFENSHTLQELRFNHEANLSVQNLHIMEECAINIPISIGLEKNSPLKEQMDKYIRRAIEGGLIQQWLKGATKSFESSIEPPPAEALMDLKKFYGGLIALGCGYALALVAFVAEKAYWKFYIERHPNYDKYHGKIISKQGNE